LRRKGKNPWSFFNQGNKYAIWPRNGASWNYSVHRVIHSFCG